METTYYRGARGREAETVAMLPDGRELTIHTAPCDFFDGGGIASIVDVATPDENGEPVITRVGAASDYRRCVSWSKPWFATAQAVRRQHERVLDRFEEIRAEVAAHYAAIGRLSQVVTG